MGIEQKINHIQNATPKLKRSIKRLYQRSMYFFSHKINSEGNIIRMSPKDNEHEYFFGYYDKSPWDATDRYMLCLRANDTSKDVSPKEKADILIIDTADNNSITKIAETATWNVQQGCMLQWLGPDFTDRIIYNDFRNGNYCSVILKLAFSKEITVTEEKILSLPVYSVSKDGKTALTLDFSRLYRLRPGYGYYNLEESTKNEKIPDKTCIWKINIETGETAQLLKYTDFYNFEHRHEMDGAEHKVNHLMISPNGKRFMVLHRWYQGTRKFSRLVTCSIDGTDMYNLNDADMVSHCCWKDDEHIFAFENKKDGGLGYYLMKDKTAFFEKYWSEIDFDGHPSFSPDGKFILFDRYPNKARIACVMVSDAKNKQTKNVRTIAKVFAPFKYDNDVRCDLHPRWNRAGDAVCFDSVFEGHRGLYIVKL